MNLEKINKIVIQHFMKKKKKNTTFLTGGDIPTTLAKRRIAFTFFNLIERIAVLSLLLLLLI